MTAKRNVLRKISCLFAFLFAFSFSVPAGFSQETISLLESEDLPTKQILFILGEDSRFANEMVEGIQNELTVIAKGKYRPLFVGPWDGNHDINEISRLLKKAFNDPGIDIICGTGTLFAHIVSKSLPLPKPVIAASYTNHHVLGLPYKNGISGVENLYYIERVNQAEGDVDAFQLIVPFKMMHVVIDQKYIKAAQRFFSDIDPERLSIHYIDASGTAEDALKRIDQESIEAIYFVEPDSSQAVAQKLIDGINARNIPTFSFIGYADVERGILAGRAPEFFQKFYRRFALVMDRALQGENIGTIPVDFQLKDRIIINKRTARQIGVSVPFSVLATAKILYADDVVGDVLSMQMAVSEALKNNWTFFIQDEVIKRTGAEYFSEWSKYLPQVDFLMGTTIVDNGTAINSGNIRPKQVLDYRIEFNQLLFSDPIIKGIQNAKKQIHITKLERRVDELDITQRTIDAYLFYLRAKALLKVERENLRAIEVNLEIADKREKIGVAGPEEVLRWQAEQATTQSNVLKREARVQQTRVVLNQLMNHPQETVFREEDVGLETLTYYIGSKEFEPIVKSFATVRKALNYTIKEAMGNSPELAVLDVALEQRDLLKKEARNRFLLPTADLSGFYRHPISDRTRGPRAGDQRDPWEVNIEMRYPFFEGGDRFVNITKTHSEYRRVQYTKYLEMQRIELDVRTALYNMYFAYPSIELSNTAMAAADRNYEITQKKYSAGVASITDLTQAQNLKFQYEGNAAISVYNFLADLAAFDRAISKYYLLAPQSERRAWFEKLDEYVNSQGAA